ncbi:MAG: DUF5979 domain-containing protein [Clostridia bacterium]
MPCPAPATRGLSPKRAARRVFTNTYTPSQTGSLTVSKGSRRADGADLQKEFTFTAVINGETETFVLKHGESKTFSDLPVGTTYTITETDYTAEGYAATVQEYTGQITGKEELRFPSSTSTRPLRNPAAWR